MNQTAFSIGTLPHGPRNNIADVSGVRVGHYTLDTDTHKTGVTVVMPPVENPFLEKMTAACHVVNGFGKTLGLMQLEELGTLETPIALTNTMNVGRIHDAMVEYMLDICRRDGVDLMSVNPVIAECNDSFLNDVAHRDLGIPELYAAIENASADFAEGDVGAGKGMTCHSLKGGIGSASRVIELDGEKFTVGVLALTNHGRLSDLRLPGMEDFGPDLARRLRNDAPDKGSCILILATDLPVDSRQLLRIIRRCPVGLVRLGSYFGHGSGEAVIGFSTADPIRQKETAGLVTRRVLNEKLIDLPFRAAAEAAEEAILCSMLSAHTVKGFRGERKALNEYL
ncbi:MAG: P1 family peptidase [Oscillospiraceae bacterium]|nr:P1 family peptidase [Oscillospiraceae bacterium]